jgi:hypothetical protein
MLQHRTIRVSTLIILSSVADGKKLFCKMDLSIQPPDDISQLLYYKVYLYNHILDMLKKFFFFLF